MMKKIALGIMALAVGIFGFGVVAQAQYSPGGEVVGGNVVAPGAPYTVVFENCPVGVTIIISQPQSTPPTLTVECLPISSPATVTGSIVGLLLPQQADLGTATGTFTAAPTTPGDYVVTATGPGYSASLTITVPGQVPTTTVPAPTTTATPGGVIPSTGNDGMGTTMSIAVGLFVVGAGLLIVATVRRRQPNPAA